MSSASTGLRAVATVVGTAVVVFLAAGVAFHQLVYEPFLTSTPSPRLTCEADALSALCDQPDTLMGFFAAVCGRDRAFLVGSPEAVGGAAGDNGKEIRNLELGCGERTLMRFDLEDPLRAADFEDFVDWYARDDQTRLAADIVSSWGAGEVSSPEAYDRLLSLYP